MEINQITFFCRFFKSIVENIDTGDRNRIITFKDVLYSSLFMNGNSCSYSLVCINMCINNIIDVSYQALHTKRKNTNYSHFKDVSDCLIEYIYSENNEPRIIGVDGTKIPLSISLKKEGFTTSIKDTYCLALISSLFDVNKKLVINYNFCKKLNEREALINQFEYMREGDILIMDRGYYSRKLLSLLTKLKVKVIFRMRNCELSVRELIRKGQTSLITEISYQHETIIFRVVKYTINNQDYYLGTTIMNKTPAYFENLYWKRWCVEINFRQSKYLLSLNNILSKNANSIQQDVYSHNILFIIHSFFRNQIQNDIPNGKIINSKNLMYLITTYILCLMLYKKVTSGVEKKISKIFTCLSRTPITSEPDRHYERIRLKPIGKWYFCSNHDKK